MPNRLARRFLDTTRPQVERALAAALTRDDEPGSTRVEEAMRYAVLGGGKRLRPVLLLAVADVLGCPPETVTKAACAVELVHGASLILDDLPCMDDASFRRGRLALHRVHGEACAVLAAHALLATAFHVLVANCADLSLGGEATGRAVATLAETVGARGMIGGQEADLELADREVGLGTLLAVSRLKTGTLFRASAQLAAILASATAEAEAALTVYAGSLGLAFQVKDDILDRTSSRAEIGKDVGQDVGRTSTVASLGVEQAGEMVAELCREAESSLAGIGRPVGLLVGLARVLTGLEGPC